MSEHKRADSEDSQDRSGRGEGKDSKDEKGDLIDQVSAYFYENDDLFAVFEEFVQKHAHKIDLSTDENKLIYTEMYEEYQQIFERELTAFIESIGYTVMDFYESLAKETARDAMGSKALFGQIMLCTTDYDIFMMMMRDTAREKGLATADPDEQWPGYLDETPRGK